jgi:YegS/Rv2252/BmrU family lipid kinase
VSSLASPARVVVIVNPISGTGSRAGEGQRRKAFAERELSCRAVAGTVVITEYAGHARDLARTALAAGASLVIAWGGDGTINEVASELAFRDVSLGVVPSGSGNGLARELQIPFDPAAAFAVALEGRDRVIDAGELDGRRFFNVAGVGLDARVAHEFAARGLVSRGFRRYLRIAVGELFAFEPDEHTIMVDGRVLRTRALIVAFANGRQYGNGARIAPHARIDDGRLDVVVIGPRAPVTALLQAPMLFTGWIDRVPGVTTMTTQQAEITSRRTVVYHVDGEPFAGGASLKARAVPRALRVRVP